MDRAGRGSLLALLKAHGKLDQRSASVFLRQLLSALAYLHQKSIIHRDIKSANCLVDDDNKLILTDFGTAKRVKSSKDDKVSQNLSLKGTPFWMAPQVLNKQGHDWSADIWSLGCTLIEMLTAKPPYFDPFSSTQQIIKKISRRERPNFPSVSLECRKFLLECLQPDRDKRKEARMLLAHPWIRMAPYQILVRYDKYSTRDIQFVKTNIHSDLNELLTNLNEPRAKRAELQIDTQLSRVAQQRRERQEQRERASKRRQERKRQQWQEELQAQRKRMRL